MVNNFGVQIIFFKLNNIKKKLFRRKIRYSSKSEKAICEDANYDPENNIASNILSQCHLEYLCDFPINYILHCSMLLILSTYQDFLL